MEYVITKKTLRVGIFGMLAGMLATIGTLCILLVIPYVGDIIIKSFTEIPNYVRYSIVIIYGLIGLYFLMFSIGDFRPQTLTPSDEPKET